MFWNAFIYLVLYKSTAKICTNFTLIISIFSIPIEHFFMVFEESLFLAKYFALFPDIRFQFCFYSFLLFEYHYSSLLWTDLSNVTDLTALNHNFVFRPVIADGILWIIVMWTFLYYSYVYFCYSFLGFSCKCSAIIFIWYKFCIHVTDWFKIDLKPLKIWCKHRTVPLRLGLHG